jgi:branched-chain amino acid transport system substrate-binding protein
MWWGASPAVLAAETPIEIPAILPLTGAAAFLGSQEQVALKLAADLTNKKGGIRGRPVQFVFYDDESRAQLGVQWASQIIASHAPVIIGSSLNAICSAIAPLLRDGPFNYCLSPGVSPPAGSYVFSSGVFGADTFNATVRYFRLKGWTRIGTIATTDATGQDVDPQLSAALKLPENATMQWVADVHFNASDISVTAQLTRLKETRAQAIIAWTTGTALATVFKGMLQVGLDVPVVTTYGNMIYPQMRAFADFMPKQLMFPGAQWPKHDATVKLDPAVEAAQAAFFAVFAAARADADAASILAWDPAMIVFRVLEKLGPDATPAQIRDEIAHIQGFAGVNGIYDFVKKPQRGLGEDGVVMSVWDQGAKTFKIISQPRGIPAR